MAKTAPLAGRSQSVVNSEILHTSMVRQFRNSFSQVVSLLNSDRRGSAPPFLCPLSVHRARLLRNSPSFQVYTLNIHYKGFGIDKTGPGYQA
jgi:hypothetical protein